jgi:hypothetical protein
MNWPNSQLDIGKNGMSVLKDRLPGTTWNKSQGQK